MTAMLATESRNVQPSTRPVGVRHRPSRQPSRARGPQARADRWVRPAVPVVGARGCRAEPVVRSAPQVRVAAASVRSATRGGVRLTERGIAVVLSLFAALLVAAVVVVGMTAVRVLGTEVAPVAAAEVAVAQASAR